MCEVCQIAVDAGATTLNIPDTVGFGIPEDYGRLHRYVLDNVQGDYVVSTHCHDDLGLAVANSLAASTPGARQVECAMNGIGERAGNAALEEVVMALRTRADYFAGLDTSIRTEELARDQPAGGPAHRLPGAVQQGRRRPQRVRPRGGHPPTRCARRPQTYEIMDAATPWARRPRRCLGKHSGRHAFSDTLEKMGIKVQGDALNQAFRPVQGARRPQGRHHRSRPGGHRRGRTRIGASVHRFTIAELELRGGIVGRPSVLVVLADADGGEVERGRYGRRHDRRRDRRDLQGERRRCRARELPGAVGDRRFGSSVGAQSDRVIVLFLKSRSLRTRRAIFAALSSLQCSRPFQLASKPRNSKLHDAARM